MVQLSYSWLAVVVDVSVKSLLVALLAGLAMTVLRVRDTNVRHRVWTAVLAGMLAMPLLVFLTQKVAPAVPLPSWMTVSWQELPQEDRDLMDTPLAASTGAAEMMPARHAAADPEVTDHARLQSADAEVFGFGPFEGVAGGRVDSPAVTAGEESVEEPAAAPPASVVKPSPIANQPPRPWIVARWPVLLAIAYVVVAAVLMARFSVGLFLTRRLVRSSRPVDPYATDPLKGRRVRLLEHPQVYVPLTVGFVRPVILLPASWRNWTREKLHAVLAHELAHVRRADWLVMLLAELNRALYWFHPLAWFLRRRLGALAEQNCDDAVLEANGDRAQYARYLLEVAAALAASGRRARVPLSSTAMARVPSVETRIDAILDSGRPLARRLGVLGIAAMLAVGIPAIILAAALQPASEREPSEPPATAETDAGATETESRPKTSAENQSAEPNEDDSIKHITGRVFDPDGSPVAGATVYAAWTFETAPYDYGHAILARTASDAEGGFELEFSVDRPEDDRISLGWKVAAAATGYGPAWISDVQDDIPLSLQLTRDESIRGRVLDLEGEPLSGVRVTVRQLYESEGAEAIAHWLREAQDKPAPQELREYFFGASGLYAGQFPTASGGGRLTHGEPAALPGATTDDDGRFELNGLGPDRLALIECEGPAIAKTILHVVTREMDPVAAKPIRMVGVRSARYYGRALEFLAEPTQPIVGAVRDADTGEPLAGVTVQVGRFADNTFSQDGYLTTTTDDEGQYRLVGAPQGGGHNIEVVPAIDEPYFPTDKTLDRASGFEPVTCDFELKRGIWIRGQVAEKGTGEPIADATVQYLPRGTNEHAEDYANYDPNIVGSIASDRYSTSADGSFRVLAIPGAGILSTVVQGDEKENYFRLSPDQVAPHLRDEIGKLKTYHPFSVTWVNALREVQLSTSPAGGEYDLQVTRGLTRRIKLTDASGRPVTGVRVLGRTFPSNLESPLETSTVEMIGLRPDEERIVAFIHAEKRIGKALKLGPGSETVIELEPCAIARGRAVNEDAEPMPDLRVRVSVDNSEKQDNWRRELIGSETDKEGRFEVLLPPGLTWRVSHYAPTTGPNFWARCWPNPGDVIDLGDMTHGTELDLDATAAMTMPGQAATRNAAAQQQGAIQAEAEPAAAQEPQPPLVYEGQVLTPDGKPAAGAKLHLVYWYSDASSTAHHNPVAESDEDGRFRFEMSRDDFHRTGDSVPPWQWASLVAVKDGYGMAWATSLAFEKAGAVLEEMSDPSHAAARDLDRLREMIAKPQGKLRLVPDDVPVQGRLVDTEGQPIAGARVRLLEISQGQDGTLDAWLAAAQKPRADFYAIRQTVPSHLYGPLAQQLTAPVRTDESGRFTVRGIGRERLARLVVEAPHIEWSDIYCRTRGGETIEISVGMSDRTQLVHGPEFSHVAAPSKPVVGVVRDKERGEPLAGVAIQSHRAWVSTAPGNLEQVGNDFSRAVTDEKGRYELPGLPKSQRNQLEFIPPDGTPYLPTTVRVDTRGTDANSVEADAELLPGVIIQGRVTDAETGRGVSGELVYLIAEDNPAAGSVRQAAPRRDQPRADMDGRFRLVVPPGPGYVAFTAFGDTYEKQAARPKDASLFASTDFFYAAGGERGPEYHAIAKLELSTDAKPIDIEMQVHRGRTMTGTIVDPAGRPLEKGGMYAGRTDGASWRPINEGRFVVAEYDPAKPRRVTFVHHERQLAGTHLLQGDIDQDLRVPLQPWGTVTGRVVDDRGDPIADLRITAGSMEEMLVAMPARAGGNAPRLVLPLPPSSENSFDRIVTDDEGRFVIAGLVPGEPYSLAGFQQSSFVPERKTGDVVKDVVVQPGQTLDMGDLNLQPIDLEALRREAERRAEEARKAPSTDEPEKDATSGEPHASPSVSPQSVPEVDASAVEPPSPPPAAQNGVDDARSSRSGSRQIVTVRGTVTDPSGRPVPGTPLYWPTIKSPTPQWTGDIVLTHVATSNRRGEFATELSFANFPQPNGLLLAAADGFGLAWSPVDDNASATPLELRLVEDTPIRGNVVDTEGAPVAGAVVSLLNVFTGGDDEIEGWLRETQLLSPDSAVYLTRKEITTMLGGTLLRSDLGGPLVPPVKADANGQFTLRGIGRDRLVQLGVEAPEIETAAIYCRIRADGEAERLDLGRANAPDLVTVHAAEFTHVAAPSNPITGIVREQDTGLPLAGVLVTQGGAKAFGRAVTDNDGRYMLTGLPRSESVAVYFAPAGDVRYHPTTAAVDTRGSQAGPIELNAELTRGVVVTGRITDAESGTGVPGQVYYLPARSNRAALTLHNQGALDYARANEEGEFRFLAPHGAGYLAFLTSDDVYERNVEPPRDVLPAAMVRGARIGSLGWKAVVRLDPAPDAENLQVAIQVRRGEYIEGGIVDPDGKPLTGGAYAGFRRSSDSWKPIDGDTFYVANYDPRIPRRLTFTHRGRKLAGTLVLQDEVDGDLRVVMQPWGTVTGRVVDNEGNGIAEVEILSARLDQLFSTTADEAHTIVPLPKPSDGQSAAHFTDQNGEFTVEGLVPGEKYDLMGLPSGPVRTRKGDLAHAVIVKPGETLDLGDMRIGQVSGDAAETSSGDQSAQSHSQAEP